jgi:hypothetical protein
MQGTGKISNKMIFDYIKENLDFDQLIWEFEIVNPAWVHVIHFKEKNRNKYFT